MHNIQAVFILIQLHENFNYKARDNFFKDYSNLKCKIENYRENILTV